MLNDYPLKKLNTWGVGGSVQSFWCRSPQPRRRFTSRGRLKAGEKVYVLGGGSNVLISDRKLDGLLIHTAGLCVFNINRESSTGATEIEIGGGVDVRKLLAFARKKQAGRARVFTGIPGTVGGALWGNAGASWREFCSLCKICRDN